MSHELQALRDKLKQNGMSATAARLDLFKLLQNHRPLSMSELVQKLPKQDQATVYRNVNLLESLGVLNKTWLGWNSKVELSDSFQHHHHHLTCIKCQQTSVLPEQPELEELMVKLSLEQGFEPTDHQLEITGLCSNCRNN